MTFMASGMENSSSSSHLFNLFEGDFRKSLTRPHTHEIEYPAKMPN